PPSSPFPYTTLFRSARSRRPPRPAIAEEHLAHVAERVALQGTTRTRRSSSSRNDSEPARCSRSTGRTSPSTVWGGRAFGFSRVRSEERRVGKEGGWW